MSVATLIIPRLIEVEKHFDNRYSQEWMKSYWVMCFPICAVYVVTIFSIQSLMRFKKPYFLRGLLTMWNVGLAVFSFIGASTCLPHLIRNVFLYGFEYGNCNQDGITSQHVRLWMLLFVLSKVVELGDTIFVVLRKSPLHFLHWYHHITVLIYCWYAYPHLHEFGIWFGGVNYLIHTIMYSYYALRSMGLWVPSSIAQLITVLQILQMLLGTFLSALSLQRSVEFNCEIQFGVAYFGLGIYFTYMLLFVRYFFHRYIQKTR